MYNTNSGKCTFEFNMEDRRVFLFLGLSLYCSLFRHMYPSPKAAIEKYDTFQAL